MSAPTFWTLLVDLDRRAETVAVGRFDKHADAKDAATHLQKRLRCRTPKPIQLHISPSTLRTTTR